MTLPRPLLLTLTVAAAVACGLAGVSTGGAMRASPQRDAWREIAWPFARDAWPAGRAFRCEGAGCGGAMELYVRPKIGFCNCGTGVTDDAEVDGVSDLDMIGVEYLPRAAGEAVEVGGLRGRMRDYDLTTPDGRVHPAAGYALSSKCDLIAVATFGPAAGTAAARRGVTALLATEQVAGWIRQKLGRG